MQQKQAVVLDRPFDVLRRTARVLDAQGEIVQFDEIVGGQDGNVRCIHDGAQAVKHCGFAILLAADQTIAKTRNGRHDDAVATSADGIGGEHHARCARIDHALHQNGRAARAVETTRGAILRDVALHAAGEDPFGGIRHLLGRKVQKR